MSVTISKTLNSSPYASIAKNGVIRSLQDTGRLPPVTLQITPIDGGRKPLLLDRFLGYGFNSNILVPVDTFEFTYTAPDDARTITSYIRCGDIVTLYANNLALSTGIIDSLDMMTDNSGGERVRVSGRDLMAQLEDQDAVSIDDKPMWGNAMTVDAIAKQLIQGTRIQGVDLGKVSKKPYLFATEPGESKLAALQRHMEALNVLAWMGPTGRLNIGKPNFKQAKSGDIILRKTNPSRNNCLDMTASFNSTSIPNRIIPIWSGQETVQDRVAEQALFNNAQDPSRLYRAGHKVTRSVVVSTTIGSSAQDLAAVNVLQSAASAPGAGNSNILNAYAKRELARQNHKELIVKASVHGHYNENGKAYQQNQTYFVDYERAGISKEMFLFHVGYSMSEDTGQRTDLYFCNKNTIVADAEAQ